MAYIRQWQEFNLEDIEKHLLIVGVFSGDCVNCRHIGIDYLVEKFCPSCKTEFKYISSREEKNSLNLLKKVKANNLNLEFIEYADFAQAQNRKKAKNFFNDET